DAQRQPAFPSKVAPPRREGCGRAGNETGHAAASALLGSFEDKRRTGMVSRNEAASATLAQRLGFGAADRRLIVNCADVGSSHSANLATWRSMTEGVATSATLMVPCPWAREAARMFQGLPVGVHLTLTSEYGGYRWRGLTRGASLHDAEG